MIIVCKQERTSNNTQLRNLLSSLPTLIYQSQTDTTCLLIKKKNDGKKEENMLKCIVSLANISSDVKTFSKVPSHPYVYVRRKQKFKAKIIKSCYCVTINENFIINSASLKYGIYMLCFQGKCLFIAELGITNKKILKLQCYFFKCKYFLNLWKTKTEIFFFF